MKNKLSKEQEASVLKPHFKKLKTLEQKCKYVFKNKNLLLTSMLHSSFVNEHAELSITSNERLEFLGDAVLSFIISL